MSSEQSMSEVYWELYWLIPNGSLEMRTNKGDQLTTLVWLWENKDGSYAQVEECMSREHLYLERREMRGIAEDVLNGWKKKIGDALKW